ncbi:KilA-N domain-containing protein [Methyloversatilis sp. MC4-4]|uniref:KilA-N domain-containing protein n=1 Tax=Methyloversatilis sp. MC4-4 TaxID=3132824 RepID=UPI003CFB7652
MKHQYSLQLIHHAVNDQVVEQRADDGYINATALCHLAGKRWYNYVRNESTGKFLRALEARTRIRVSELVQELRDSSGIASTWVHPKVAIHLAQWLSEDFAVQVSEWVHDWMTGGGAPRRLPYHVQRHMLNLSGVPAGHFSILQEMTHMLIAPLDAAGYELPEKLVPDISMGLFLCKHLRDQLGIDTKSLPTYIHLYPDGRKVTAKLYPDSVLADFRRLIQEKWLPEKASKYFAERDPEALPYLDMVLIRLTYKPGNDD